VRCPELVQRTDVAQNKADSARSAHLTRPWPRATAELTQGSEYRVPARFRCADACLREATVVAKPRSGHDLAHWRKRLSDLDARREVHFIAELGTDNIWRANIIRAIDTGMSGPDIGGQIARSSAGLHMVRSLVPPAGKVTFLQPQSTGVGSKN
jgi:hypothetical protein